MTLHVAYLLLFLHSSDACLLHLLLLNSHSVSLITHANSMDIQRRVLMLPWLAHGHISPFLQLSKRLARWNFHVYFCTTPANISSIQLELSDEVLPIELVLLHLPELPNLPSSYHTTKSLTPNLMPALKQAFDLAEPSFSEIIRSVQPNVLIYDFIQPWAALSAAASNTPAILFLTTGAAFFSFFLHLYRGTGHDFPFPCIYLNDHEVEKSLKAAYTSAHGVTDVDRVLMCADRSCSFIAIKTLPDLESKYIEFLSLHLNKEIVPVGPLLRGPQCPDQVSSVITWLDNKDVASTLFVSFGSEYFLSEEEVEEVAKGLELAQVSFVWVIRFPGPEKADIQEALPNGFLNRVGHLGLILEGWAPQTRILGHPSIGGFLTHCGWSSVLEGISFGVPLVALPLQLDQPINARLVVEIGVGLEVVKGMDGKYGGEEIAKTIGHVMVDKEGGVRREARNMSVKMHEKDEEGIDKFVGKLIKLCHDMDGGEDLDAEI